MAEPKTRATDASVDEFLQRQVGEREADCRQVAVLMRKVTGEAPVMWGEAIIGFGRYAVARSDGKSYEWPIIGFSPRKNDLALYLASDSPGYNALLAKLGKHKTSTACLYLKKLADVDLQVLERLIVASVTAMEPRRIRDPR